MGRGVEEWQWRVVVAVSEWWVSERAVVVVVVPGALGAAAAGRGVWDLGRWCWARCLGRWWWAARLSGCFTHKRATGSHTGSAAETG